MEELNFEGKIKRLEELTNKLENETLPLDETLKLYEEAKGLIASIRATLKEAEEKVEALQK